MSSLMTKKLRKRFLYPFLRLTQLVNDQGDLGWRVGTLVEGEEYSQGDCPPVSTIPNKGYRLKVSGYRGK